MARPDHFAPLDLSGRWRAGPADEELRRLWYTDEFDDSDFVDIDVPAHWQTHSAFGGSDEPLLYRRRFSALAPGDDTRAWLHLDGVCAQGDVWLDGEYLGNTDGAWVPHAFEVTGALAERHDHTLAVDVTSPAIGDPDAKRGLLGTWQDGPYVTPGWNPGGIWRPVRLRRTGPVTITAHRVLCTAATATRATVTIRCELDSVAGGDVVIATTVADVDHERRHTLARGKNTVTWTVDVADPDLWWPAQLGDQPLVDIAVHVSIPTDSDDGPEPSDGFATRCGLRHITLRDWIFTVNGEQLFIQGVLAPPATHDLAAAPAEAFTAQVRAAQHAGCNLLRVHAHISNAALYDESDRTGMLIWQDLPLYRGQNRSVRRTAVRTASAAVDALGAHPSIAVWCAHDEPDAVRIGRGRPGFASRLAAHQLPNWNRSVLDRSVKRALVAADPSRPVIGSSGTWPHPPKLAGTDTHLNLGWSEGEAEDLARLARAIPRAVRFVQIEPSPSWARDPSGPFVASWPRVDVEALIGAGAVDPEVTAERLPPDGFDSPAAWHRAARNLQSQLIRTQVETLRRLKYRPTGGFVVAHLHDLRPVMSPSLIDHDGTEKPAHAALQSACAPVLLTLDGWPTHVHPGDRFSCDVHIVSDLRSPIVDARVRVHLSGGTEEPWVFAGDVPADACVKVGRIEAVVPHDTQRLDATLTLHPAGAGGGGGAETTSPTSTATYTAFVHHH